MNLNPTDPEEQASLSFYYQFGDGYHGVPKDINKALFWLVQAAENGYADAQYSLGLKLTIGSGGRINDMDLGLECDMEKARYWMRKAAAQGHKEAQKWVKDDEEPNKLPSIIFAVIGFFIGLLLSTGGGIGILMLIILPIAGWKLGRIVGS